MNVSNKNFDIEVSYSKLVVNKNYIIVFLISEKGTDRSFTYNTRFVPTKSSGKMNIKLTFEEYDASKEYTLRYYFI